MRDSIRRSWLCRSASAPSQQACEPVQDRCSGPCSRPRHAATWRSRNRAPAGWVAWATNAITEGRARFRIGTQWFSRSGCGNRRAPAWPCGRGKLAQFSLLQRFAVWWVAPPWPILSVPAVLLALCRLVVVFNVVVVIAGLELDADFAAFGVALVVESVDDHVIAVVFTRSVNGVAFVYEKLFDVILTLGCDNVLSRSLRPFRCCLRFRHSNSPAHRTKQSLLLPRQQTRSYTNPKRERGIRCVSL